MSKVEIRDFETTSKGENTHLYTIVNNIGESVTVCDYGATIVSLMIKDKDDNLTDVVLGYKHIADYENNGTYFGGTIGRCCGRIANGKFTLKGKAYTLPINNGNNHLHGGNVGFNRKLWNTKIVNDSVVFTMTSADGEEGYPGNLKVKVKYTFDNDSTLTIEYGAVSDKDTVCNMTNHSYFNLNGDTSGSVRNHLLKVNSKCYIPINKNLIPTGEITPTKGSPFDFSEFKEVETALNSSDIQISLAKGIDHMFVLNHNGDDLVLASSLIGEKTGINLKCYTTQKGVHIYSANYVDVPLTESKHSKAYKENSGICFETQGFPDAVNQDIFPTTVIKANEKYKQTTKFVFN